MNPFIPINPNHEPLTPARLKTFEGFEHLSDEEAGQVAEFIHQYSLILHECYCHNHLNELKQQGEEEGEQQEPPLPLAS